LNSSDPNADLNASVTFKATITSPEDVPTGAVQFLDGTTVLGTAALNAQGVAAYSTSALAAGTHTIGAIYAGGQNFMGSKAMLTQQVTAPGFSITVSPEMLTLRPGQIGEIEITLTPVGGYTGTANFSCVGLPKSALCIFNPATLTVDGSNTAVSATMTITTMGSNLGMVSQLHSHRPEVRAVLATFAWLPSGLLGLFLYRRRKQLSLATKQFLLAATLLAGAVSVVACGAPPDTPVGSSMVTITATGTNGTSQSITMTLTITP
jgi:hypothetical protein